MLVAWLQIQIWSTDRAALTPEVIEKLKGEINEKSCVDISSMVPVDDNGEICVNIVSFSCGKLHVFNSRTS